MKSASSSSRQPNILLINCDDLGYGDLGCYGSPNNKTPALDRMASEGVRFTDFCMASAVCSPSRGAMLTGCYPPRIGFAKFGPHWVLFPGHEFGLNPEEKTLARYLKDLGYATALVGKWHCGDQPEFLPTRHGFDHYFGLPYSNDMSRMTQAHCPIPLPLMRNEEILQQQPDQAALTERYVSECVEFIRAHKDRPFFLYLAHMHVHLPLIVAERFLKQSSNGPYGAAVECIDWATDVLLKELQRLGIDQNTILIFTSDNGSKGINGGSNGPLRGHKGTGWEGGFRVPCIVRWPDRIAPGRVSHELMTGMDLLPTLVHLAGGSVDDARPIDGLDFSAHLTGESDHGPRQEFFYYFTDQLCAVRRGPWKLHRFTTGSESKPTCELYNLVEDPGETRNLAATHPDIVDALTAALAECRTRLGDSITNSVGAECRPPGRVDNPRTLTEYDPEHPYMIAAYDGGIG